MTSHLNLQNKQGMSKLASLIKQAGFDAVKVTVKNESITLTPNSQLDLAAGLSDIEKGKFHSFEKMDDAISFLEDPANRKGKKVILRK